MLGKHHPLLRRIRALRGDGSLRRSELVFLAEGLHLVSEALATNAPIETIVASPRLAASEEGRRLVQEIRQRGLPFAETSDELLVSIQDTRSPQPVMALVRRVETDLDSIAPHAPWVVVLDTVQDPGNLGSIVRTADGAGCGLSVVTGRSADPFHPRAVRATMGSIFRVPVAEAATESVLARLRAHGFEPVGADPHDGTPHDETDLRGRLALVLGGESGGISPVLRAGLSRTTRIPMRAGVESLSVAAAAAVLLFEIARQRRR